MKKICTYFFITACIGTIPCAIFAQAADTLKNVELFSKKPLDITTSTVNVQQLTKAELSRLNSQTVADALKYFSGVLVKDYGGIGGLKTVSVRSLGANHTGVMYDGIMIPDAQGGQIDLGRLSLDNIETLQLYNNQPLGILFPARTYASASVISLSSSQLNNNDALKTELSLRFKFGSFGFIDPSVYFKHKVNKYFSHAINAEYQSAKGNYPYVDYETGQTKTKRTNADIRSTRFEYDAAIAVNDSNQLRLKAYYYDSKRGLPGSVVLYNNTSDERLNVESFFVQASWKKQFSPKSSLLLSGKYSADHKYYLDPSYQNNAGKLENEFYQKEFYLSGAYGYKITKDLSAGCAIDYFKSTLRRTDPFAGSFANPDRDNVLSNFVIQWKKQRYEINGNLLYTVINEKVEQGASANNFNKLTPAISASLQPFKNNWLRIRASYKNIFRAPTFDDLYYTNIGNTKLRPEIANQYSIGFTYSLHSTGGSMREFIFTSDFYYNKVTDKILAVPRQNLFQWTMLNIGEVSARGGDAALHVKFKPWGPIEISTRMSGSLQRSLDVSDPSSASYNKQLPYTPEHSGSVNLNLNYRKLIFSYNLLLSTYRYRLGDQIPENKVEGWATHDISIGFEVPSRNYFNYKLLLELNNINDRQYEIIKYYPMPGFNFRFGFAITFKK